MLPEPEICLSVEDWKQRVAAHRARAEVWTRPFRERRSRGNLHPVFDFLFIYYRFPPSQLENWHPAWGTALESDSGDGTFSPAYYSKAGNRCYLDASKIDSKTRKRLLWTRDLCQATQMRPPQFGCFGMHEWAMVYKGGPEGRPRHEGTLPLRLPQSEIDAIVEQRPICCSHFDAFRFFTATAMPMNRIQPTHDTRVANEQSGCLHTNMDLYKWTAKAMPWVGSDLLWETFEFAVRCREVDMRASPYDCGRLGYTPIPIETESGRAEYEQIQRELTETARPLRARLIQVLGSMLKCKHFI